MPESSSNEPSDLAGRVDALEAQMRVIRHDLSLARADAAVARALAVSAAGAYRDVAEVRAKLTEFDAKVDGAFTETSVDIAQITALLTNKIADNDQE